MFESQVSPVSVTGWVDPNELHIDLTKIARHRHLRRSTHTQRQGEGNAQSEESPVFDKKQHRVERSRRIKALVLMAAQRKQQP